MFKMQTYKKSVLVEQKSIKSNYCDNIKKKILFIYNET